MRQLFWVVLVTATLAAGCATREPGSITFNSYFGGAIRGAFDCVSSQCLVAVSPSCAGSACGGSLQYDPINLANGNGNVKITWTLPDGYAFCKQIGDGVFLKSENSDQFKLETYNGSDNCAGSFTIMAANTKPRPAQPYQYKVIFHKVVDPSTTPVVIDPTPYVIDPSMINK